MLRLYFITLFSFLVAIGHAATAQDRMGCDPDSMTDCTNTSMLYVRGIPPFKPDPERAEKLLKIGKQGLVENCQATGSDACGYLLNTLTDGAAPPDLETIERVFHIVKDATEAACSEGKSSGCYWRSILYADDNIKYLRRENEGLERNVVTRDGLVESLEWTDRAESAAAIEIAALEDQCDDGDKIACADAAALQFDFNFLEKYDPDGIAALINGCESGDDNSCQYAAQEMEKWGARNSDGVADFLFESDDVTKLTSFCEAGNGDACLAISKVVPFDQRDIWTEKACDAGNDEGCNRYGWKLLRGNLPFDESAPATQSEIIDVLTRACDALYSPSCHALEVIGAP